MFIAEKEFFSTINSEVQKNILKNLAVKESHF